MLNPDMETILKQKLEKLIKKWNKYDQDYREAGANARRMNDNEVSLRLYAKAVIYEDCAVQLEGLINEES